MEKLHDVKPGKSKEDCPMSSPERQRRSSSSGRRQPPALRLMSPFDSDQELNDLEVASVLEGEFHFQFSYILFSVEIIISVKFSIILSHVFLFVKGTSNI
jgi:hypothetical protein